MRHMRRMRLTALLLIVRIPLSQENPEDLQVLSRVWLMILSNQAIKRRKKIRLKGHSTLKSLKLSLLLYVVNIVYFTLLQN